MDNQIQTIEPWATDRVDYELRFRTETLSRSLTEDLRLTKLLGHIGILASFLMLLANLVLRTFFPLEEITFLVEGLPGLQAVFSEPGIFIFLSCFLMAIFYLAIIRTNKEAMWSAAYFESAEEVYNSILRKLDAYEESDRTDEECEAYATQLEEAAYSRIAHRHALENNFTRAVMIEFPPPSLVNTMPREEYLPLGDITSLTSRFLRTLVFLALCWAVVGQVSDLARMLALWGFFVAG